MLELTSVLSTDTLTLKRTRFAPGSLYRALSEKRFTGVPTLVSHDSHRPLGWTLPIAVSLQPHLTRLHGVMLVPQDNDERRLLETTYRRHLQNPSRAPAHDGRSLDELRRLLLSSLDGTEEVLDCAGAALCAPDLARRVAPDLFSKEDDDGLVPMAVLTPVQPGVYGHGDLVLFAHPYFRRSLSRLNNLNGELLAELQQVAAASGTAVRVRLDPDLVGLRRSVRSPIELDYWYGPRFTDDLAAIPPGLTRHEASPREKYFHAISRTEFRWQSRDGQHILEAEELRDLPTFGDMTAGYGCRYVHSIVDETSHQILHLDGAIREYSEEELVTRPDQSLAEAPRKTRYTKLWRIDGELSLARWKLLIHQHYRDNSLVAEYLDPEAASDRAEVRATGSPVEPEQPVARLLPPAPRRGDSVRVLVSLGEARVPPLEAATVVPLEGLRRNGETLKTVEDDTFELRKLLARSGRTGDELQDLAWCGFYTGWRRSEVFGLPWADVDWNASPHPEVRIPRTKNRTPRVIPIDGDLQTLFERRRDHRRVTRPDGTTYIADLVFHREGKPIGDIRAEWNSALTAAGIARRTWHDFRRTAARNMVNAGVPEKVAMEITGHLTRSIFDRYHIVAQSDKAEALRKTQKYLAEQSAKGNVRPLRKPGAGKE